LQSPITREEIDKAIDRLKCGKSAGCDKLITEMFKYGNECFYDYFLVLFNQLYNTGEFPDNWSTGIIVPLHKSGDVNNPDNYRGITLLSVFSKIYIYLLLTRELLNGLTHLIKLAKLSVALEPDTLQWTIYLHCMLLYRNMSLRKKKIICHICGL
jgi:hypothetical protein